MDIYEKVERLAIGLYNVFHSEDWMEIAPKDVEQYWYGLTRAPKVYIRASKEGTVDLLWWDEDANYYSLEKIDPEEYYNIDEMLEAELFDDAWHSQRIRVVQISDFEKGEEG